MKKGIKKRDKGTQPHTSVDGRDKLSQLWSFKSEPLWVWRCWEKDL